MCLFPAEQDKQRLPRGSKVAHAPGQSLRKPHAGIFLLTKGNLVLRPAPRLPRSTDKRLKNKKSNTPVSRWLHSRTPGAATEEVPASRSRSWATMSPTKPDCRLRTVQRRRSRPLVWHSRSCGFRPWCGGSLHRRNFCRPLSSGPTRSLRGAWSRCTSSRRSTWPSCLR